MTPGNRPSFTSAVREQPGSSRQFKSIHESAFELLTYRATHTADETREMFATIRSPLRRRKILGLLATEARPVFAELTGMTITRGSTP